MRWFRRLFGKPTRREFAEWASDVLARAGATGLQFDEPMFLLRYEAGGNSNVTNLENFYLAYCAAQPWQRQRVLERFSGLVASSNNPPLPASWSEGAAHVYPAVRDRFAFEMMRLQARLEGAGSPDVAVRDLTDRLCLCLVYDAPDFMFPLNVSMLEKWGVSFDEARERALANLRAATPPARWERPAPGLYVSAWQDDYDSTRLLLDEIHQGLDLQGVPVALVPYRNRLILTGSEDAEGLAKAFELAEAGASQPAPLSVLPLRWTGSGWAAWDLPKDHPCGATWRRLRLLERGTLYNQQKDMLEEIHRRENVDVFVASFGSIQDKETGELRSWCSWAKGVLALLPCTDLISFADPEAPKDQQFVGFFPWEHVETCCGDLLQRTNDVPERFRVEAFPSEEQIRAMRGLEA